MISTKNSQISTKSQTDILDIQGASELLGYTINSVYQLTSKRIIPHFKVPGMRKLFFSKSELEKWILDESNRIVTTSQLAILAINRSQN